MAAAFHRILSPPSLLLLLFLFSTSSASTVYEILTQYGLPQGLLPDGVKEYSLSSNGDFVVELLKPCYVDFSDTTYYEKTITGKLEHGQISDISGIKLRHFFLWVPITGIFAAPDGRTLEFTVGAISERHFVSEFAKIRPCKSNPGTSCRGALESLSLISEGKMDACNDEDLTLMIVTCAMSLEFLNLLFVIYSLMVWSYRLKIMSKKRKRVSYSYHNRHVIRQLNFRRMIFDSDLRCIENTRMDRNAFYKLCNMLQSIGGLSPTKNMDIEEMVGIFLYAISHHAKNRVLKREFVRSGETVSRQFGTVLQSILKSHGILLKKPEPVPADSNDVRWKWFKNCLGALDGTYIKVNALDNDKPRYRNRKGDIATNVLGVCSQDMQFIYILPGWEGSAADSRVLRDAISRRHGLKVPKGFFYLCDAGYTNGEGFLTPYRGQRYHLNEWRQNHTPRNKEEFFNYKHSSARNAIERCFGFLKMRWGILRERSWYPVKTKCRVILACALLHNHIRKEMTLDPLEAELSEGFMDSDALEDAEIIQYIETSDAWTTWRDNLAQEMWTEWLRTRNN